MQQLFDSLDLVQKNFLQHGLTKSVVKEFQNVVIACYTSNPRSFPWRETTDPYSVMVSEVMLQQTQAERVVQKYLNFLQAYPTTLALSLASTSELLLLWQGLGYSRRALNLRRSANEIVERYAGIIPSDLHSLLALPGIGPYTAGAIRAFAFDLPGEVIDTNIRRVYIHVFFPTQTKVTDRELTPILKATEYLPSARLWYSALMDVGHLLPKTGVNANQRSSHYVRQSPLVGSNREVRGIILKLLTTVPELDKQTLSNLMNMTNSRIEPALRQLSQEGFVVDQDDVIKLA